MLIARPLVVEKTYVQKLDETQEKEETEIEKDVIKNNDEQVIIEDDDGYCD
jgi:hypothetical protein